MKKSILLLFSLLIFVGNVWGDECYLVNSTTEYGINAYSGIDEIDFSPKIQGETLSFEIRKRTAATQYVDIKQIDAKGNELVSTRYWVDDLSTDYQKKSIKLNASTVKITLSGYGTLKKFIKNIKVTQKKYLTITSATSHDFGNVVYDGNATATWTVNYKYSSTSLSVSSNNSAFTVSPTTIGNATCGKTGTGSFTITFKPTALGTQSGTITVGNATISVSGVGTPTIPSNLNATEELLQSTLSWSGANKSYYQVYNGSTLLYEGKNNSYLWTGRQWGTSYTFSVKACTAKDTNCSDSASKTFNTKSLLAPTGVSVSNISYDNAKVTWDAAEGASLYRVYLSIDNGSTYTKYGSDVMATSDREMPISGLTPGKKYYVKVESVLNGKETSRTDSKDFTTTPINIPQNVTCTPDYLSATLNWTDVADRDKYGYYVIYDKNGQQVGTSKTNSYKINGLQWGVNYGNYTVKVHAFDTESAASDGCNVTTKTLLAPEITGKTDGFDNTVVTWNAADGATSYVMYLGTTKVGEVEATVTSYTFEDLELDSNYSIKVESKLNDKETTSAVAQDVKTGKLNASASFTISNASYTTCQGEWTAIPNATGYKVVASNGAVTIFDGHDTTSGVIAGLLPNNTYTCTVYGMYNNAVSKNGKQSNSISTLTTKCETESLGGADIAAKTIPIIDPTGGYNFDDKYSSTFTTSRNQATISFNFATSTWAATGYVFYVEESADGSNWTRKSFPANDKQEGSGSVTLSRGKFKFRFVYSGNFGATISNVNAVQAVYMEVDKTNINFGNLVYGNSASATINVAYSTMVSNITTTNVNYTLSPASVGYDDCRYGTTPVTVTFNANGDAPLGEQNTLIYIGSNAINIYATVTLPVPVLSLVSTSYQSVNLSWAAIPGAERYKVNCSNGTSAWINSSDFTGTYTYSGLLQNTDYTFTVQAYGGEELTDESNSVTAKTQNLSVPTINASNIGFDHATLNWSVIDDATDYELYDERTGKSYIFAKGTNSVTIDTLSLHTSYTYRIYSRLADETRSLTYNTVTFSTLDLPASTSFTLSNISYNAMDAAWDEVEGATGYMIRERWTRMVLTFDANTKSTTIYGLKPGTLYEFYLYATYNEIPATESHKLTAQGTTLDSKCPVQIIGDHTLGCGDISDCGFDWSEKVYEITTDKNAPILYFAYEINQWATKSAEEMTQYGPHVRVEAKEGNNWVEKWRFTRSQGTYGGSINIENLNRSTRNIRIIYKGNLNCKITGCTIDQGTYFELNNSSVSFGEHYVGSNTAIQTVSANYSSQAASIVSDNTSLFTVSKATLGSGTCEYGTDEVTVTANTELETGTYEANLIIGRTSLPMSITILQLPAPENFQISEQNPTSTVLTWDDVNLTENGYKIVCKQNGRVIDTKNVGGDVTTCTFTGLQPNKEYTYIITTMYNSIENESAEITGKTNMLPAPQNFALDVTSVRAFSAIFTWTKVTNATGYKLEWQWDDEITSQTATVGDVSEYKITELEPDTKYSVKITTLYGDEEHGASGSVDVTTTCVISTIAAGDEPSQQLHTITLLSGEQLDDLSFVKGSTIKFKSYTNSTNIKFVQLNVTINGSKVSYSVPEIEIEVSSNVYIESVYEYAGIAQVVDEHGDIVYGTLTEAVDKAADGANINLLNDVEQDMVVNKHIYFNGNGHKIQNMYIKKDGNVELTGDVNVVMDFGLEVTPDKAGQYDAHDKSLTILGDAYIDVQFDNVKRDKWYAFSVPFPVKMNAVKNAKTLGTLVYGSDYMFLGFDGEARAAGEKGWITYAASGTLEPGKLYMIGTDGSIVHRFYKVKSAELISNVVSFNLESHTSAKGGNLSDWNALGNSQLFNVGADQNGSQFDDDVIAQIYKSTTDSYLPVILKEHVMSVTSPIFVQKTDKCFKININKTESLRSANAESALYNLQITKEGAANFDDQMFVAASDDAPSSYVAGYALMKLGLTNSIAQIYSKMYNTNLCMINAPYSANGMADIPLTIDAPAAGNYILSLGKQVNDGTALYLVKDGAEIHNFNADGSYSLYLAKGSNNSYSLRVKATDVEDITTPATETEANGVNVYVKENVLVIESLAEGSSYSVGNTLRTLNYGVSNGDEIRIPLTEKGVYWVNTGSAKVKVLNN